MRVLVTGGTGFVGAWTAKAAQDAGHQVRFLVRNPDRLRTSAAKIGVDIEDHVVGDIADRASTDSARITLRPIGNPLPLGFVALAGATLLLSGLQLGWLRPSSASR